MNFQKLCADLEQEIIQSYESGVTLEAAEKLAAKFLYAQLQVSSQLATADLNARMHKSGLKAIKAAVYTEACSKEQKKPTESQLEHTLNMHDGISEAQDALDQAEVLKNSLERYMDIFGNAHVFMRGIAKNGGAFHG